MATRCYDIRRTIRLCHKRLDRARRLFRFKAVQTLKKTSLWRRDDEMDRLCRLMLDGELLSGDPDIKSDMRCCRFGICRAWWRLTPGYEGPFGWYRWSHDFHFESYTWRTEIPKRRYA
jgi:hypothetical protein